MSEALPQAPSPEQIVFGNAFSFANGESDEDTQILFFTERIERIKSGAKTWLPRTLDSDSGVCADLFLQERVVATIDFNYEEYAADVYTPNVNGVDGNTLLCEYVSFEEAVKAAEQFAEGNM